MASRTLRHRFLRATGLTQSHIRQFERAQQAAAFLRQGVSILDSPGNEFWWPEADQALFDAIKSNVRDDIPVYELDNNINDDAFAEAVTAKLLAFLHEKE